MHSHYTSTPHCTHSNHHTLTTHTHYTHASTHTFWEPSGRFHYGKARSSRTTTTTIVAFPINSFTTHHPPHTTSPTPHTVHLLRSNPMPCWTAIVKARPATRTADRRCLSPRHGRIFSRLRNTYPASHQRPLRLPCNTLASSRSASATTHSLVPCPAVSPPLSSWPCVVAGPLSTCLTPSQRRVLHVVSVIIVHPHHQQITIHIGLVELRSRNLESLWFLVLLVSQS